MKKIIIIVLLTISTISLIFANDTIKIKKVNGSAYIFNEDLNKWEILKTNNQLSFDTIVKIQDKSLLYLIVNNDESIISGPFTGRLGELLSNDSKYDEAINHIIKKIPDAKQSDRKIEITVQSAAVIKGNKVNIKKVPYKWQISKEKTNSNK